MAKEKPVADHKSARVWEWATRIAVALTIAACSFLAQVLAGIADRFEDHEVRLTVVESNRFTDRNGLVMKAEIMEQLIEDFRENMREIKAEQRETNQRLRALEVK